MVSDFSISNKELLSLMGTARAPRLIDVSLAEDIFAAPWRLPGTQYISHRKVKSRAEAVRPDTPPVTNCQKSLKLNNSAAALLRAIRFNARVLHGGNAAWCAADHLRLALTNAPASDATWVLGALAKPRQLRLAWLSLLDALPWIHPTLEDQIKQALPLIDAAWVASREPGQ